MISSSSNNLKNCVIFFNIIMNSLLLLFVFIVVLIEMSELLFHNIEKEVRRLREMVTLEQIYSVNLKICYPTMFLGTAHYIFHKGYRNALVGGICIFELSGQWWEMLPWPQGAPGKAQSKGPSIPLLNSNFLLHVSDAKMPVVNAPDCPLLRIPPLSGDSVLLGGAYPRRKLF